MKLNEKYNIMTTCGLMTAYSGKTAHPFQKNGAPFRLKLSKAQLVN